MSVDENEPDDGRWTQVTAKLIAQTESEQMKWAPRKDITREDLVGVPFMVIVSKQRLLVYQYQFKRYIDESDWFWTKDVAIEFVDRDGTLEWGMPKTHNRLALLEVVRRKTSGADDFADKFLSD